MHEQQRFTELRETQEALRTNEQRWRDLTEALPQLVWSAMPDGACDYFSAQWTEHTGVSEPDLLGWRWLETLHPDDREPTRKFWLDSVAGRHSYDIEYRVRRRDGEYRWFKTRGVPIRGSNGTIIKWFGTGTDITDLRETQEALRASEQRWRDLTEALPQLVWSAMPDGACDYFSAQWTDHTGVPEPDLLGWRWLETLHPDDREPTRKFWLDSVAERHPYDIEYRVRRRDGEYRWFKTRGVPVRDSNGTIIKWFGTGTDITDLRQTQEALRERERQLDSLMGHVPGLAYRALADEHWTALFVSKGIEDLTGYPADEFTSRRLNYADIMLPEDRPATREAVFTALRERRMYEVEHRIRRKDGSIRWIWARGHGVFAPDGSLRFIEGLNLDMTSRKQAEEALRESEERFRGTFENAAVGIRHQDLDGRFLRVNQKFCSIVGYPRDELLQRTGWDITHPDDLDTRVELPAALLRGESPGFTLEKRYVRQDGSVVWVELSVSLQRDAAGNPDYIIGIVQDISERKRLDAELRQAKDVAEAANRAKDEFLANVSHEIRTPMNAILGMTELALDTELTEDQRQCLNTVKSAADNLLIIINDLLDFTKIAAGKLELDLAEFSLRAVVGDTLRTLAIRAHKKGLELIYDVNLNVPDGLVGDSGRLRQMLLNLVGNAIKFTDEGEVVVRVELDEAAEARHDEYVDLRFIVRDTGIGIPRDKQERIFLAFEQEDTSTTRKYGGTGLGLTIAARLAALMGGRIMVESEPGVGSTFAFTARFGRQSRLLQQPLAAAPDVLRDLAVMVVDDNATNRRICDKWLHDWQMNPTCVESGVAALEALSQDAAGQTPFELILLDAHMPDMDGYALAARIRKRAELSAARIVLLTSGDRFGDLARIHELQIDAHLLKPVTQERLLETIMQVMSRGDAKTPAWTGLGRQGHEKSSTAARSLSILAAEDNELNRQLLEQLLGRRGHRVRLVTNGREALATARDGEFDLLLLDMHMPEMDGFQVVRALREHEKQTGGHLPIIALTARSRKEDRDQCLAAGMDDFLAKPIQAADLWAAIDRVGNERPGIGSSDDAQLIAPNVLLAACGGDATILENLCRVFKAGLPDLVAAVRDSLHDGDAVRLREAAHNLCGMISTFSTRAGQLASELEDLADQGQLEPARPLVEQLGSIAVRLPQLLRGVSLESLREQASGAEEPRQFGNQ
jgi:two-component system sensor histidine kinase/response regulator